MSKAEQKRRERIRILQVMIRIDDGGGQHAVSIADATDGEVSRRGIGQKLNAMSLAGLVEGHQPPARRRPSPTYLGSTHFQPPPMLWTVTDKGRQLAESEVSS